MLRAFADDLDRLESDVCIVGAGPVGLALALACEQQGLTVLVLESGHQHIDAFATALTAGHVTTTPHHVAPDIAVCRGLGGTSRWWGGRCVPLDDVDFAERPRLSQANWPIPHHQVARWYDAAAAFFGLGPPRFTAPADIWSAFGDARGDRLERWAPEADMARRHRAALQKSRLIDLVLGATVTRIRLSADGRHVDSVIVADRTRQISIRPRRVVLACGGLETTRMLLRAQQDHPDLCGGRGGVLGRGYMGHVSGKIADLVLTDPSSVDALDFFLDDGAFARRRFTIKPEAQQRERLLNIAFWADNPSFHRPAHGNGALSLVWLALAAPFLGRMLVPEGVRLAHVGPPPHRWAGHALNIVRSPISTVSQLARIVHARTRASPRKPGFLLKSRDGRYGLNYIAEQGLNNGSAVRLSDKQDALGLPFLEIDLHYTPQDTQSVLRAHDLLDRSLRAAGLGHLDYHEADADRRLADILRQAKEGYHQIGTTRMGLTPQDSVVDPNCRAHGVDNLYVASSSVFPTSGQANPTFAAVALAHRLAAHLAVSARRAKLEAVA